jgi:GTP-binding protein Era
MNLRRKEKRKSAGGGAALSGSSSDKARPGLKKTAKKPKATKTKGVAAHPSVPIQPSQAMQTETSSFDRREATIKQEKTPSLTPAIKYKTGTVALVGRPNVGKSTLLNRLLGQKVVIVSDKPQTTRLSILGIKTTERGQIIFVDNPGIHKPLHKLNKRMMSFVYSALETADVICLLIDATQGFGHGDAFVLETLGRVTRPVFLLINKVDIIRKDKILLIIDKYKDLFPFQEIIPLSALSGANLDVLEKCIYDRLPAADKVYDDRELSDQSERFLLAELIREKILNHVEMELPFVTAVYIDQIERRTEGAQPEQPEYREYPTATKEIGSEQMPEKADKATASVQTMEEAVDRIVRDHLKTGRTIRTGLPVQPSFRPEKRFKGKKARQALPVTYIKASIFVERPNHRQIILGRQGQLIKLIGIEARRDMEQYLDSRVYLELQVKVRPHWRDSAEVLDLIEGQK